MGNNQSQYQGQNQHNTYESGIIDNCSWFEYIMGMRECDFRNLLNQNHDPFYRLDEHGNVIIQNKTNNKEFGAGHFSLISIGELRKTAIFNSDISSKVPLRVISRTDNKSIGMVDIMTIQANPRMCGDVIQVASNTNTLECPDNRAEIEYTSFISDYIYDKTQGPAASIGCGAAAISRLFLGFMNNNDEEYMQTNNHQINILKNLNVYFPVTNGYVNFHNTDNMETVNGITYENSSQIQLNELSHLENKMLVAIHENCQTIFDGASSTELSISKHNNYIHQVFSAAINLDEFTAKSNLLHSDITAKAKFILETMYLGVYMAAQKLNARKIILTFLGMGAFNNNPQMVVDAIISTHATFAAGSIRDVQVIYYPIVETNKDIAFYHDGVDYNLDQLFRNACKNFNVNGCRDVYEDNHVVRRINY